MRRRFLLLYRATGLRLLFLFRSRNLWLFSSNCLFFYLWRSSNLFFHTRLFTTQLNTAKQRYDTHSDREFYPLAHIFSSSFPVLFSFINSLLIFLLSLLSRFQALVLYISSLIALYALHPADTSTAWGHDRLSAPSF